MPATRISAVVARAATRPSSLRSSPLAFRSRHEAISSPSSSLSVSSPSASSSLPLRHPSAAVSGCRGISSSEKPLPKQDVEGEPGPTQDSLPHVSEEAAEVGRITGEGGPEIEEQGTPAQEILQRSKTAQENAPKVMQPQQIGGDASGKNKSGNTTSGSSPASGARSYSTSVRRSQELQGFQSSPSLSQGSPADLPPPSSATSEVSLTEAVREAMRLQNESAANVELEDPGHKFGLPTAPYGQDHHKDYRYDPCIKQVTALLMRDGKLAKAQSNMSRILNILRTSPPPTINPSRPLLPGAPPPSHLPLNPNLYLQLALDSVAPLFRLKSQKGIVGGGASVQIPVPLRLRQRRRQAMKWVLEAVDKKPSRLSGRGMFAQKVADELVAIVEGRSGVWDKRHGIHKIGTAARSNIGKSRVGRKRF